MNPTRLIAYVYSWSIFLKIFHDMMFSSTWKLQTQHRLVCLLESVCLRAYFYVWSNHNKYYV